MNENPQCSRLLEVFNTDIILGSLMFIAFPAHRKFLI